MKDDGGHFESGDEYGMRAGVPPSTECPDCHDPLLWPNHRNGYCERCNRWFTEKDIKKKGGKAKR